MSRRTGDLVVEIAPSATFSPQIALQARASGSTYLGVDFDPDADGRTVDLTASLTDLPMRDRTVDLLICFHVLEHIPDDGRAMAEISRVLSEDGIALVQVPIRRGVPTDEDPDADEATRLERFGQKDHVRYYGDDFEDRLRAQGLRVQSTTMSDFFSGFECGAFGLPPEEPLWLVSTSSDVDLGELRRHCALTASQKFESAIAREVSLRVELVERAELAEREHQETAAVLDRILRRPSIRARRFVGRVVRAVRRRVPLRERRRPGPIE